MEFHPIALRIEQLLQARGFWYERFEHAPVRTSEEAARVRPNYSIYQGTKALILRGKKGGTKEFFMVGIPGHLVFERKKLQDESGYRDVRFVTEDEVRSITGGVEPGGVPPLGALFHLPTFVDQHVFNHEHIIFNAGDRRVSIAMRSVDFRTFLPITIADLARFPEDRRCISPLAP